MTSRNLLVGLVGLAGIAANREWLENHMARHMLLEFPLLIGAGALVGHGILPAAPGWLRRVNQYGFTGFALVSVTLAFWMIPAALDASLASSGMAAIKYLTLLLGGVLLPGSFQAAPLAVQGFWTGNLVWMTATVGMLYQDVDRQLCLYYRTDMQDTAGRGLVVAAAVVMLGWSLIAWVRTSSHQGELLPASSRRGRGASFSRH
jgi:hypothetical protein